tara:strand:- start:102 stop:320 length:219 start_codon:yes stop_codon:yes gene_type:complete
MKQTAVGELLEYFVKQQKEGCSHWCIHDLIAQLYVAKEMEKEQIIDAVLSSGYVGGATLEESEYYYNENYKK